MAHVGGKCGSALQKSTPSGIEMLAKVMAMGVFAAATAHASAMCLATTPADVDDVYGYYVALTNALQSVKPARDEAKAAGLKVQQHFNPTELLTGMKYAEGDFECARMYLDGYDKSSNKGIALSALGVINGVSILQEEQDRMAKMLVASLNGQQMKEGEQAKALSDINVQVDNAWQMLMVGIASSSQASPHNDSSGRVDGIVLSPKQRADVIKRLRVIDPAVEHKGDKLPLEASVQILFDYLGDKRLKSFGR